MEFTEYVLPNGDQRQCIITAPEDVEAKAAEILEHGYALECEILRTGIVSFTIGDGSIGVDMAIELSQNDPESINIAVRKLIMGFDIAKMNAERASELE